MARRRAFTLFTAGLTMVATALAVTPPASAVTYGTPVAVPARSVPWVLSLWESPDGEMNPTFTCTATAVSPQVVVTAAHCVQDRAFYYVKVGANRSAGGRFEAVEAIVENSKYGAHSFVNDIAVLRTLTPLGLRSYASLATPMMGQQAAAGHRALRIYGWGMNQNDRITGQLQTARLDVQNAAARRAFGGRFKAPLMIAAGQYHPSDGTYAGSCSGDSGGPLATTIGNVTYLVGVTSYGASDCDIRRPTVFTALGAYSGWVKSAISSLPREAAQDNRALPQPLTPTTMTGDLALGGTLTCVPGEWTANAKESAIDWYRDNETADQVRVATGPDYQVVAADSGHTLVCTVFRWSDAGHVYEDSAPVAVPAGLSDPTL